jgi:hypothetical protein
MCVDFFRFDHVRMTGDSAMHPRAPRLTRQAALLRLAGTSLLRCLALPGTPTTAHPGASSCRFQDHAA